MIWDARLNELDLACLEFLSHFISAVMNKNYSANNKFLSTWCCTWKELSVSREAWLWVLSFTFMYGFVVNCWHYFHIVFTFPWSESHYHFTNILKKVSQGWRVRVIIVHGKGGRYKTLLKTVRRRYSIFSSHNVVMGGWMQLRINYYNKMCTLKPFMDMMTPIFFLILPF